MITSDGEVALRHRRKSAEDHIRDSLVKLNRKSLAHEQDELLKTLYSDAYVHLPELPVIKEINLANVNHCCKFLSSLIIFLEYCEHNQADREIEIRSAKGSFNSFFNKTLQPFYRQHFGLRKVGDEYIRYLENPDASLKDKLLNAHYLLSTYELQTCELLQRDQVISHEITDAAGIYAKRCESTFGSDDPHVGAQFQKDVKRLGAWKIMLESHPEKQFAVDEGVGFAKVHRVDEEKGYPHLHERGETIVLEDIDVLSTRILNGLNLGVQQADMAFFTFMDPIYDFQESLMKKFTATTGITEPSIHINDQTGEVCIRFVFSTFHDTDIENDRYIISPDHERPLLTFTYEMTIDSPGAERRADGRNWRLHASYKDNTVTQCFHAELDAHIKRMTTPLVCSGQGGELLFRPDFVKFLADMRPQPSIHKSKLARVGHWAGKKLHRGSPSLTPAPKTTGL